MDKWDKKNFKLKDENMKKFYKREKNKLKDNSGIISGKCTLKNSGFRKLPCHTVKKPSGKTQNAEGERSSLLDA
jgi:hypothetical protein